jgi:DNA-binding transcriptional LysR family regulator
LASGRVSLAAIRVFEAAARLGSFREAAGELGMTPTAVSHRIRNLEAGLGLALFRRSHRKVDLTAAGEDLFEAARTAVAVIDAAAERLAPAGRGVTLATTPAFAALWLAPRLSAFQSAFPDVSLRVEAAHAAVDLERTRGVDLALRYRVRSATGGRLLARETFAAFAAPALALAPAACSGDGVSPAALLVCRWQSAALPEIPLAGFEAALGARVGERVTFDDEHHAALAAVSGKGIAILSDLLAGHLVAASLLRETEPCARAEGHCYRLLEASHANGRRDVARVREWLLDETAGFRA